MENSSGEYRLTYGEIDFFITEQVFDGYVDMNKEHKHNYYEVFYVEKGNRLIYLNNTPYMMGPENIAIIPPGFSHKTTSLKGDKQVLKFFGFSKNFFDGFVKDTTTADLFTSSSITVHINEKNVFIIVEMLNKLIELSERMQDELTKARIRSIIFDVVFNYTDYTNNSKNDEIYDKNGNLSKNTKFLMISNYIKKHINERITLEKLETVFGISKYEISRNFKKYCGSSFVEYLNTIRINQACSLLTNTKASVNDIAESVGFDNLPHFSKTFKKYTGMSPKQFATTAK